MRSIIKYVTGAMASVTMGGVAQAADLGNECVAPDNTKIAVAAKGSNPAKSDIANKAVQQADMIRERTGLDTSTHAKFNALTPSMRVAVANAIVEERNCPPQRIKADLPVEQISEVNHEVVRGAPSVEVGYQYMSKGSHEFGELHAAFDLLNMDIYANRGYAGGSIKDHAPVENTPALATISLGLEGNLQLDDSTVKTLHDIPGYPDYVQQNVSTMENGWSVFASLGGKINIWNGFYGKGSVLLGYGSYTEKGQAHNLERDSMDIVNSSDIATYNSEGGMWGYELGLGYQVTDNFAIEGGYRDVEFFKDVPGDDNLDGWFGRGNYRF